jgi:methyl-accepting chemotaxis protein
VAIVVGFAVYSSARQGPAGRDMATISDGMSHQWNADMMHDGPRADVMSALYARTAARITAVIEQIDDGQRTIAAAVEQQSATTDLMARNVGEVSTAAGEIQSLIGQFRY